MEHVKLEPPDLSMHCYSLQNISSAETSIDTQPIQQILEPPPPPQPENPQISEDPCQDQDNLSVSEIFVKKLKTEAVISEGPVICEECGKSFQTRSLLNGHKLHQHNPYRREYQCPECDQHFKQGASLWSHYFKLHMDHNLLPGDLELIVIGGDFGAGAGGSGQGGSSTICGMCGKVFKHKHSLKRHYVKEHEAPGVRYPCPECGKDFKDPGWLSTHLKVVHGGGGRKEGRKGVTGCDRCGRDFGSGGRLWKHRVDVHGMGGEEAGEGLEVKVQKCGECGEVLLEGKMWRGHLEGRHKGGDYWRKCMEEEEMRRKEASKERKREARRRMEEEGVGPEWLRKERRERKKKGREGGAGGCEICGVWVEEGLEVHLRELHGDVRGEGEGQGGYRCGKEGCGRWFTRKEHLRRHLMELHCELDERIVERRIFKVEGGWREGEGNRYECTLCGGRFGHRAEVRIHVIRGHPEVYRSILEGTEVEVRVKVGCPMEGCWVEGEDEEEVRRHLEEMHGEECWRCPECERVMLSPEEMEAHWGKEHGDGDGEADGGEGVEEEEVKWMWSRSSATGWGRSRGLGVEEREEARKRRKAVYSKWGRMRGSCEICGVETSLEGYTFHLRQMHGVEEKEWRCEICERRIKRRECWLAHMELKHGGEVDMVGVEERGRRMNVMGGVEGLDEIHKRRWWNGRLSKEDTKKFGDRVGEDKKFVEGKRTKRKDGGDGEDGVEEFKKSSTHSLMRDVGNKWSLRRISCEICKVSLSLGSYGGHLKKVHGVEEEREWDCERCGEEGRVYRRRECWMAHMEVKHGGEEGVDLEELLEEMKRINVEGGVEGLKEISGKEKKVATDGQLKKKRKRTKSKAAVERKEGPKKRKIVSKAVKIKKLVKLSEKLEEMGRSLEKEKRLVIGPLKRVKVVQKKILYLDINS